MPAAARMTDMHTCPLFNGPIPHVGGVIIGGASTVLIGSLPAAILGNECICTGPSDKIIQGSASVLINGMPAVRQGDKTAHGGVIVSGFPSVQIG